MLLLCWYGEVILIFLKFLIKSFIKLIILFFLIVYYLTILSRSFDSIRNTSVFRQTITKNKFVSSQITLFNFNPAIVLQSGHWGHLSLSWSSCLLWIYQIITFKFNFILRIYFFVTRSSYWITLLFLELLPRD